jgi:hypothetical protein
VTAFRSYWSNAVLALIALMLVQLSFQKGLDAGMASGQIEPSWRYRVYAAPIVLSQLYYHRPYDYVGYNKLAIPFQAETPSIDELAEKLKAVANVESDGLFFILADDKGVVDFTRLAFQLYGIRTASLYYMYFTILFGSCVLFVVGHFTDRHKLVMLVLLCLGLYATMPAFLAFPPGINILDIHAFGVLSLVAALHILVSATDADPTRRALLITTAAQALIMTMVYHTRSSSITQTLGIAAAYPIVLYLSRDVGVRYRRRFVPLIILLVAVSLLPIYQRLRYHPDYFGRRATLTHIVYHNLLIGMQWNPNLQKRYGLGLGDLGIAQAVDAFLESPARNTHPERHAWAASGLNTVTTQQPFDWVEYEEAARDLYATIWRESPKEALLTALYWHPLDVYQVTRIYTGYSGMQRFDQRNAYNPFRPIYVVVLLVTAALCSVGGRPLKAVYALMAFTMFASALLVPILVYAGGFIILAEAFAVAALLMYTALAVVLSQLFTRSWQRFTRHVPIFERSGA